MNEQLVSKALTIGITGAAMVYMMRQCRKPGFGLGTPILLQMNLTHTGLTTWGLQHVTIGADFNILDVGCGGGKTINRLAAMAPAGKVAGIDYSAQSVKVARRTNAELIRAGRVSIEPGTVSHLPFPDASFDLVTAVETHYYWPDPVNDLREIGRVLKPGGTLLLIAEAYRPNRPSPVMAGIMKALRARYLTVDEHRALLTAAGFSAVDVDTNPGKGWLSASGRRPA